MLLAERPVTSRPAPFDIQRRAHGRLAYSESCLFQTDERAFNARALNISEGGICVRLQSLGFVKRGTVVALLLQNFPPIDAVVRWTKDRTVGMQFTADIDDHPHVLELINRLREGKPAWVQPHETTRLESAEDFIAFYDGIHQG